MIRDITTAFDTNKVISHPVNAPVHVEGDFIYIACVCDGAFTLTPPSGAWTTVVGNRQFPTGDENVVFSLYRKQAGTAEPGSYSVSSSGAERGALLAFSVDSDNGTDGYSTADGDSGTATLPDLTTTGADRLILRIVATEEASIPHEQLGGYTFGAEVATGIYSGGSLSLQYKTQAAAGAAGADTVDIDSSQRWLGVTLAIALTAVSPPSPSPGAGTVQILVDELAIELDDPTNATWSEAEIVQFLNDAIRDYSVHFPRVVSVDLVTAVSRRYNLPADFTRMVSVEYPADNEPPDYLVSARYTTPGFFEDDRFYDVVVRRDNNVADELILSDLPTAGGLIRLEYVGYHSHTLTTDDSISVPSQHHHLLKAFVVWQATRQLLMNEQQSPTNVSSLIMAQLSQNTERLHEEYVRLVERTLFGVDDE